MNIYSSHYFGDTNFSCQEMKGTKLIKSENNFLQNKTRAIYLSNKMLFLIIKYPLGSMAANLRKKIQTKANVHIIYFTVGKKAYLLYFGGNNSKSYYLKRLLHF